MKNFCYIFISLLILAVFTTSYDNVRYSLSAKMVKSDVAEKSKLEKILSKSSQQKIGIQPVQIKKQKEIKLLKPKYQLHRFLRVPYSVRSEVVTGDLQTIFVVSSHFIARLDYKSLKETARLQLKPYSKQRETQVQIALHPNERYLYVALDQVNKVTAENPRIPQHQLLILEVDARTLRVKRIMPFGKFDSPSGRSEPEKVYDLILSHDGRTAYTFGFYPKVGDSETVGSISWSDLATWTHGDTQYIQDIVQKSNIRAAIDAARWPFRHPYPFLMPRSDRILISTDRKGSILEGWVHPSVGFTPIKTISNLNKCKPLCVIGTKLYMVDPHDNLAYVNSTNLNGEITAFFPFPSNKSSVAFSKSTNKVLFGGEKGLMVVDLSTKKYKKYEQLNRKSLDNGEIKKLYTGNYRNKVLIKVNIR